jgi:hypothetical protein
MKMKYLLSVIATFGGLLAANPAFARAWLHREIKAQRD